MAVPGHKARLLVGDFHLAAYATSVSAPTSVEVHDSTVLTTEGGKAYTAGLASSAFNVEGYYDTAEHADLAGWLSAAAQPVTYGPSGFAVGAEVWMVDALESQLETGGGVAGLVPFSLAAVTNGLTDFGAVLHGLTAETADGSAAAVDGGAASSGGGVGHLHVTAFSGFSGAVVTIEDSANGSSGWATIGTFTTVAGATAERITIAGTIRQYTRATVDVTGTGSATYAVALARR